MNMKAMNVLKSILMALGLLMVVGLLVAWRPGDGGMTRHWYYTPLAGTASYASTETVTTTAYDTGLNGPFGAVQIHAAVDVTSTQNLTVTPQFSNQTVDCSSVTHWFNATEYETYSSWSITTQTQVVTQTGAMTSTTSTTAGSPTVAALSQEFYITGGDGNAIREIPVRGRCLRMLLISNGPVFTPTLYIRFVNRQ